jgi:integrase
VDAFDQQRLSANRSRKEIKRLLDRVVVAAWRGRSVHVIGKQDVVTLVSDVERRGTPYAANKLTKVLKAFLKWCVGRGILEKSPAEGISLPCKEVARDRTLTDDELASVLKAAREIGGSFGGIVELLALTGQRREEVARMTRVEIDLGTHIWTLPASRTKNGKAHLNAPYVFSFDGALPFQNFTVMKRRLDALSGVSGWRLHDLRRTVVSGMAALGVAPHVADRILNHVGGTISGVAAVYQRHEFMAERKEATDRWGEHIARISLRNLPFVAAVNKKAA